MLASDARSVARTLTAIRAEQFVKYNVFWIGREALEWLKSGRRLAQSEQSPRSFDIPHPSQWLIGG